MPGCIGRESERGEAAIALMQLRSLYFYLREYAQEHGGRLPASILELAHAYPEVEQGGFWKFTNQQT
jgi:hypothetical protein